ncbi:MAG: hypothetical protein QNJ97_17750 [Myxococcota bacterium]|nr:hypothetical protein [Myxococcota bacterium]
MHVERLMNVARALREAKNTPKADNFTMTYFGFESEDLDEEGIPHGCGTPCCAIGFYAVREDLQDLLRLNADGDLEYQPGHTITGDLWEALSEHFDISDDDVEMLFDSDGCGMAGDNIDQAIAFIENFASKGQANAQG